MSTPIEGVRYAYDAPSRSWVANGRDTLTAVADASVDWADGNEPWAYTTTNDWEQHIPGIPMVNLSSSGADFKAKLTNTLNAAPGRVVVNLPEGVYTFTEFTKIGSGSDLYAFGFYHPNLAGFCGAGADKTIIEMGPNAVSGTQLTLLSQMTQASFQPLNMGVIRIDTQYNSTAQPIFIGGVTFEAAPQPLLTSISGDITNNVYVPQSAPHQGVVIYSDSSRRHPDSIITHTRFRGAGKAMTSQPPFEMANITSQRNHLTYQFCEFDGRMSPRYDVSQPRKCGPIMFNGGVDMHVTDCWLHHSNISRYAANDESVLSGTALFNHYTITRTKIEQITNNQNKQPPINGGNTLGGYTDASLFGWESSNAEIELTDVIASVDNVNKTIQFPTHVQLTNTGAARSGGRLRVRGGQFRNTAWPWLEGFMTCRIDNTANWWIDGFGNTFDVQIFPGQPKQQAHIYTGVWPPSAAYIAANNLTPQTHYIVKDT